MSRAKTTGAAGEGFCAWSDVHVAASAATTVTVNAGICRLSIMGPDRPRERPTIVHVTAAGLEACCTGSGASTPAVDAKQEDDMTTSDEKAVREHLAKILAWEEAHVGFDKAVHAIPAELRGKRPAKLPYSAWQLVEHLRITQRDILDFCRDSNYQERKWPDDYWPASAAPPSAKSWGIDPPVPRRP